MNDVITDYQKWKQQGENLRVQAKQAMETRYRELLIEAVQIAEMYRADFGAALKPPAQITAFRYKAAAKAKGKKVAPKTPAPAPKVEAPAAKADPKVVALQKKLATAKKKLDDAKTAGGATRVFEDKIYEIEDALRLAASAG
jgi:alpha/beta superfamily hydrolase